MIYILLNNKRLRISNMQHEIKTVTMDNIFESESPRFLTSEEIFGRDVSEEAYLGLPHDELIYSNPYYYKRTRINGYAFNVQAENSIILGKRLDRLIDMICQNGSYSKKIYCGRCMWEIHGMSQTNELVLPMYMSSSLSSYLYKIVIEEYTESEEDQRQDKTKKLYCIQVIQMGFEKNDFNIYSYIRKQFRK